MHLGATRRRAAVSALVATAVLAMAALPECGARHGVAPERLVAVATVESSRDPLAIGVNGPNPVTLHPATKEEAVARARALLAQGRSIDLGLLQINNVNLALLGLTVETAFDACQNLRAGAEHLAADYV
jgi:type IV secretion system protein VirB1